MTPNEATEFAHGFLLGIAERLDGFLAEYPPSPGDIRKVAADCRRVAAAIERARTRS